MKANKLLIGVLCASTLMLIGCSGTEGDSKKTQEEVAKNIELKEEVKEAKQEIKEESKKETKVIEKKPVLKNEFLNKFELDEDTKAYENGTFIMKDGSSEIADYYSTWGGEHISDMLVVFQNEELVRAKIFLNEEKTIENAIIEIGWDIKDVKIEEQKNNVTGKVLAYNVTYDQKFKTENIKNYPNELD